MEKLNLTLSPAKKQSLCQTKELKTVTKKASNECGTEIPIQEGILVSVQSSSSIEQTESAIQVPVNSVQTSTEPAPPVSEIGRKNPNEALSKTLNAVQSEALLKPLDTEQTQLSNDKTAQSLPEAGTGIEEANKTCTAPDLASPMNQRINDLETVSSDKLECHSVIDEIKETKSNSLMQLAEANVCADGERLECTDNLRCGSNSVHCKEDMKRCEKTNLDVPVVDQSACSLKPNVLHQEVRSVASPYSNVIDTRTQTRETSPVPTDDNSILSVDLNHLRYIPKIISPLSSPMRPLTKALRMESPYKGFVHSYNKDLSPENTVVCPSKNLSNELNKENQKPLCPPDKCSEMECQMSISSDELEEGEIVSDEEKPKTEKNSENNKKSRGGASSEIHNLTISPQNQKSKTVSSNKEIGKLVSVKASGNKNKDKYKVAAIKSSKDVKTNKTLSIDYFEKIAQIIVVPSTVQEIMQMLKAIRADIRKNYMKFKVQFPIQHFHRIIESAILNFTSLIKYLDFSKMSKSDETLKLNLCEIIESKLKQVKKNGIVAHLFEQKEPDMKKQLWKLVDDQLDYLFEKIKKKLA
uniref:Uncharacterized protein n=1 Tax=Sphenodon punctatus TaxID=8508 RepID=A0A8D0G6Y6_SPHPU